VGHFGEISQVDQLLRSHPQARKKFREAHPEILFWALNGRKAMSHKKKGQAGIEGRLGILCYSFPPSKEIVNDALSKFKRSFVARDDILDALVSAVTALLGNGRLSSIPVEPQFDRCGLPMEMVYYIPDKS
jgi:predicted RNase H-like nuclease